MITKRSVLGACAMVGVVALSACSSGASDGAASGSDQSGDGASSGKAVKIEIFSNFTSEIARGQVLDELIAEFNEQHQGEYEVVSKAQPDWPTLQQQIRSRIAAGDTPDLFLYNYNPTDMSREESGELMDWTQALNDDPEWKDRFDAGNLEKFTVGSEIVALPGDQSPALFYYNSQILDEVGISEFPKTWDDLLDASATLKEKGYGAISMMTADDAWHTLNVFSYLAISAGGSDVYVPGSDLNQAAIVKAADYTKQFLELSTADAVGGNYASSSGNFVNGQSAMVVDGPWLISALSGGMEDPCIVKMAAAPTFGDGVAEPGYTVTDSLNAWAAAKQDDPAKVAAVVEWMKFFTSNESAVRMAIDGEYPMAVHTELTDADREKASCQMAEILEITNDAPSSTVQMGREISSKAQAEMPSMLEGLALGSISPEQFASDLQAANQ